MAFSFTRSFGKVQAGVELLGLVVMAVRAVEEAIPESGQGSVKLKLVLDQIGDVWDRFAEFFGSFEEYAPKLRERIKALVEAFNNSSLFKKG